MAPTSLKALPEQRLDDLDPPAAGLRERKKTETRDALTAAAHRLFAQRGFDATTVDDIAAVVGVSPRTFHRYFARKEDVVFADSEARFERFRNRLADVRPGDTVLSVVRRAAEAAAAEAPAHEADRLRLVARTPALRADNLGRYDELADVISTFAAQAIGEAPGDRWPSTFGACVMAALTSASRRWAAEGRSDLADEYTAVFDLLEGLDRPFAGGREAS